MIMLENEKDSRIMLYLINEKDLRIMLYLIKSKMPVIVRHTIILGSTKKGKTLPIK